jgi:MFS family permease
VTRTDHRDARPQQILGREFLLLLLANFLQQTSLGALLFLPSFLVVLGADRGQVGWLIGIGHGSGVAAALLAGAAIDRWGRKPVALAGSVLTIAGLALTAVLKEPDWVALVQQLLLSAGAAFLLNSYYVWAADIIPEARRTEGLCYFGASSLLPLAMGYLPLALGISGLSLRWFFLAAAVAVAAAALLTAMLLREPARPDLRDQLRWHDIATLLASRSLRPVWLITFGFGGAIELFSAFATLALTGQMHGNPGVFWLLYSLTAVVLRLAGARLPVRLGVRRTMLLACISAALAAALTAVASRPAWAALAGALGGFAHGFGYPALITMLVGRAPSHLRGTAVAVLDALWYVVILVLAPVMGSLADWAGRDAIVFELGGAGTLVIAVVWFAWERRLSAVPRAGGGTSI